MTCLQVDVEKINKKLAAITKSAKRSFAQLEETNEKRYQRIVRRLDGESADDDREEYEYSEIIPTEDDNLRTFDPATFKFDQNVSVAVHLKLYWVGSPIERIPPLCMVDRSKFATKKQKNLYVLALSAACTFANESSFEFDELLCRYSKLRSVADSMIQFWKETHNRDPEEVIVPHTAQDIAHVLTNAMRSMNRNKKRKMSGVIKLTTAYNKVRRFIMSRRTAESDVADDDEVSQEAGLE